MAYPTVPASLPSSKSGRVPMIIGGVLLAIGVVGGAFAVARGALDVGRTVNAYQRVSLVSGGTVEIDDPGTHRVFFENPGADEGLGSTGDFVVVGPGGDATALSEDSNSETYSINGRDGRKIGTFSAPTAGTYEIIPVRQDGATGSGVLAIGRKGPTSSIFSIIGGVFGGLLVGAIGTGFVVFGGVRRGRAKRAAMGVGGPMGTPMPGWGPPPAPSGSWTPPGWTPGGPTGPTGSPLPAPLPPPPPLPHDGPGR